MTTTSPSTATTYSREPTQLESATVVSTPSWNDSRRSETARERDVTPTDAVGLDALILERTPRFRSYSGWGTRFNCSATGNVVSHPREDIESVPARPGLCHQNALDGRVWRSVSVPSDNLGEGRRRRGDRRYATPVSCPQNLRSVCLYLHSPTTAFAAESTVERVTWAV